MISGSKDTNSLGHLFDVVALWLVEWKSGCDNTCEEEQAGLDLLLTPRQLLTFGPCCVANQVGETDQSAATLPPRQNRHYASVSLENL